MTNKEGKSAEELKGKTIKTEGESKGEGVNKKKQLPLDKCSKPHTAENSRLDDIDDACDDGVR